MARRRKSGFGALAGAFGKSSGRRRRGKGLTSLAPTVSGGKRTKTSGLAGYDLSKRMGKTGHGKREMKMVNQAADAWRDKFNPTQRLVIQEEIDETISNDSILSGEKSDYTLRKDESTWQRMVRLVRNRFRKPVL